MEPRKWMEERLWAYMDNLLTDQERLEVEQKLRTDPIWKQHYDALLEMDRQIQSISLEEPSMRFTKNVMEQIASVQIAPATKSYINKKIIFGIAAFFMILIGATLTYVIPGMDFSTSSSPSSSLKLDALSINWKAYFNNTTLQVFLIIDAVAALFFLDRYLQRKKSRWQSATE